MYGMMNVLLLCAANSCFVITAAMLMARLFVTATDQTRTN